MYRYRLTADNILQKLKRNRISLVENLILTVTKNIQITSIFTINAIRLLIIVWYIPLATVYL